MADRPALSIDDLPPDVRAKVAKQAKASGVSRTRERKAGLKPDAVRSYAFRVMHVLAELSRSDRARVLRQAERLNKV
jgi:hypothetical protein